jgi:hypothetical protein
MSKKYFKHDFNKDHLDTKISDFASGKLNKLNLMRNVNRSYDLFLSKMTLKAYNNFYASPEKFN